MTDKTAVRDLLDDWMSPAMCWRKLSNDKLTDSILNPVNHSPVSLLTFDSVRIESRNHVILGNPMDIDGSELPLETIVATHQFCDVYYHWVFDIMPRVVHAMTASDGSCRVMLPTPKFSFQKEWLDIAAPKANWSFMSAPGTHLPGPIAIPSASTTGTVASPWAINLIKRTAHAIHPSENMPRLYIRRQGKVNRKIVNEAELERSLNSKGFISIDTASISVREQIALFKGAKTIVSAHGSALANLVFCRPETSVIEIFGPYCGETCYPRIAHQVELQHIGVQATEIAYFGLFDRIRHAMESADAPFHFKMDPVLVHKALDMVMN